MRLTDLDLSVECADELKQDCCPNCTSDFYRYGTLVGSILLDDVGTKEMWECSKCQTVIIEHSVDGCISYYTINEMQLQGIM